MTLDEVQKLTPDFNWGTYFETLSLDPKVPINVDQPKFLEEFQKQLKESSVADWKVYLTWQVSVFRSSFALDALRAGKLRVQSKIFAGRGGDEAALEALRRSNR